MGLAIAACTACLTPVSAAPSPHTGMHVIEGSDGSLLVMPSGIYPVGQNSNPVTILQIQVLDSEGNPTDDIGQLHPFKRVTLSDGTTLALNTTITDYETIAEGALWNTADHDLRILLDDGETTRFLTLETGQGIIINNTDLLASSHQMVCACKCGTQTITVPCPQNTPAHNNCGCENASNIRCAVYETNNKQQVLSYYNTSACERIYIPSP